LRSHSTNEKGKQIMKHNLSKKNGDGPRYCGKVLRVKIMPSGKKMPALSDTSMVPLKAI